MPPQGEDALITMPPEGEDVRITAPPPGEDAPITVPPQGEDALITMPPEGEDVRITPPSPGEDASTKLIPLGEDKQYDSEDEPLIIIKKRLQEEANQNPQTVLQGSDNFGSKRPHVDCHPYEDNVNTSDSDMSDPIVHFHATSRKMRYMQTRDKSWKKKPSKSGSHRFATIKFIKRRKRVPLLPTKEFEDPVEPAIQASLFAKRLREIALKTHTRRLDDLLKSNNLKRYPIPADGDCFFAAVLKSNATCTSYTSDSLRKEVCDHLHDNQDHYIGFITNAGTSTMDYDNCNTEMVYKQEIAYLRVAGHWSNELADTIPLAVSNIIMRPLIIYTSKIRSPIVNVWPTLADSTSLISDAISLAYISNDNEEHYDACMPYCSTPEHVSHMDECTQSSTAEVSEAAVSDTEGIKVIDITPRKRAKYCSPKKKLTSRKRKCNPDTWQKNIHKRLRLSGAEYKGISGKLMPAKHVQAKDCSKCRFKCSSKISYDNRQKIFSEFWSLNSNDRQRDFVCQSVESINMAHLGKRRHNARRYTLMVDGQRHRVCQAFFLRTLNISHQFASTALQKRMEKDGRTNIHQPRKAHNALSAEAKALVTRHIDSFPVVESHYTRKHSVRKYLESGLSVKKMYALYKEETDHPVKESMYRKIFCENFNLGFHAPKKDQCESCEVFNQKQQIGEATDNDEKEHKAHLERKEDARYQKDQDKQKAVSDGSYHTVTFDLQAVLTTPCSRVSQLYYKRKLRCYNLTIYSLSDKKVACYLWNETDAKRGSNEIGTCLYQYLKSLPPHVKHACLYSDSCAGQNRNRYIANLLHHVVSTFPNLQTIDQKFLETGHTQMECDSVHAAIEHAKKATSIYVPSQWDTVITMSRKSMPYVVIPLKYDNILDIKAFGCKKNYKIDSSGNKIQWRKVKWLQFRKNDPDSVYIKYDFKRSTEFAEVITNKPLRGRRCIAPTLTSAYSSKQPISALKKRDLLSMCKSGIIPQEFHSYFENMTSSKAVQDGEPESEEEED